MLAILLSTYNGEKYLPEQLDSLIRQTFKNWVLFVRDDNSNDKTLEIIQKYSKQHANIVLIEDDCGNLGTRNSFFKLLQEVEADYYMFCDQDDVWKKDKVLTTFLELKSLEKKHPNQPALVFSDLTVVNKDLDILSFSMWQYTKLINVMEPKYLAGINLATGCTVVFNKFARNKALDYQNINLLHDSLLSLVTYKHGIIKPIFKPLIFYRQHGDNVVGASDLKLSVKKSLWRIYQIVTSNIQFYRNRRAILKITFFKFILLKLRICIKRI